MHAMITYKFTMCFGLQCRHPVQSQNFRIHKKVQKVSSQRFKVITGIYLYPSELSTLEISAFAAIASSAFTALLLRCPHKDSASILAEPAIPQETSAPISAPDDIWRASWVLLEGSTRRKESRPLYQPMLMLQGLRAQMRLELISVCLAALKMELSHMSKQKVNWETIVCSCSEKASRVWVEKSFQSAQLKETIWPSLQHRESLYDALLSLLDDNNRTWNTVHEEEPRTPSQPQSVTTNAQLLEQSAHYKLSSNRATHTQCSSDTMSTQANNQWGATLHVSNAPLVLLDLATMCAEVVASSIVLAEDATLAHLLLPQLTTTRQLQRFVNLVTLNRWVDNTFYSVADALEDKIKLYHVSSGGILTTRSVPFKRAQELSALRGARYATALVLEAADMAAPFLREFWRRASAGVVWLLVSIIGRAVGLIYLGIKKSTHASGTSRKQGGKERKGTTAEDDGDEAIDYWGDFAAAY